MTDRARATLEPLEDRLMMSGDVSVHVAGGKLLVRGDNADNAVQIYVEAGQVHVVGKDANGQTLINGAQEAVFGHIEGVRIQMKQGDDRVEMAQVSLSRDVAVNMGAGDDTVVITDATFAGRVRLSMQSGDDLVSIGSFLLAETDRPGGSVTFAGNLAVHAGAGTDRVYAHGAKVAARTTIHMGSALVGREVVALGRFSASFESDRVVVIGQGTTSVIMGSADRQCRPTVIDSVAIRLSSGAEDRIVFRHVEIGGRLSVHAGEGDDQIQVVEGSTINGPVRIDGGDGIDQVTIAGSTFAERVNVDLGAGDDLLTVSSSEFQQSALLTGGDGEADRIRYDLNTVSAPDDQVSVREFELFM